MKKKAQSWYIDYIVGFIIFVLGMLIFLQYSPNIIKSDLNEKILDSEILSDILISEGVPNDWNSTNYFQIGLTNNYVLDLSKLKELKKLDYYELKSSLPINSDFYFQFNTNILLEEGEFVSYGKPGANKNNIKELFNPNQIISVERFIAHDGEIIKLELLVWSK